MRMNAYEILLQFRNAKRDAAFKMYGKDWRKFIPGNGYWNPEPKDEEEALHLQRMQSGKTD